MVNIVPLFILILSSVNLSLERTICVIRSKDILPNRRVVLYDYYDDWLPTKNETEEEDDDPASSIIYVDAKTGMPILIDPRRAINRHTQNDNFKVQLQDRNQINNNLDKGTEIPQNIPLPIIKNLSPFLLGASDSKPHNINTTGNAPLNVNRRQLINDKSNDADINSYGRRDKGVLVQRRPSDNDDRRRIPSYGQRSNEINNQSPVVYPPPSVRRQVDNKLTSNGVRSDNDNERRNNVDGNNAARSHGRGINIQNVRRYPSIRTPYTDKNVEVRRTANTGSNIEQIVPQRRQINNDGTNSHVFSKNLNEINNEANGLLHRHGLLDSNINDDLSTHHSNRNNVDAIRSRNNNGDNLSQINDNHANVHGRRNDNDGVGSKSINDGSNVYYRKDINIEENFTSKLLKNTNVDQGSDAIYNENSWEREPFFIQGVGNTETNNEPLGVIPIPQNDINQVQTHVTDEFSDPKGSSFRMTDYYVEYGTGPVNETESLFDKPNLNINVNPYRRSIKSAHHTRNRNENLNFNINQ